uniref:Uncharacterized protein n=1 Tax=Anguilla anguilla TaxID=7936 RepID=A0A0E9TMG0_ANGAN
MYSSLWFEAFQVSLLGLRTTIPGFGFYSVMNGSCHGGLSGLYSGL